MLSYLKHSFLCFYSQFLPILYTSTPQRGLSWTYYPNNLFVNTKSVCLDSFAVFFFSFLPPSSNWEGEEMWITIKGGIFKFYNNLDRNITTLRMLEKMCRRDAAPCTQWERWHSSLSRWLVQSMWIFRTKGRVVPHESNFLSSLSFVMLLPSCQSHYLHYVHFSFLCS